MAEPKPLASLTSGLLARKGAAQPAMRRQSLTGFGNAMPISFHDDLGWNDMGGESAPVEMRPSGLTPMGASPVAAVPMDAAASIMAPEPVVVTEQKALVEKVAAMAPPVSPPASKAVAVAPKAAVSGRKAAFTLRLDAERHLKLRLVCAVQNRSAQQIVTDALDQFLSGLPEIDRLADQLPRDCGER
ncbi:hypothetical protein [Sphingobium aromaticiconvertens]|uniref:hypothetical protein n=1 Tax=Sphingobium aromaticiconvertens TaxID=365341 RepID=UPI0030186742